MRKQNTLNTSYKSCDNINFILLSCGLVVQNTVHKRWINNPTSAQYPQPLIFKVPSRVLYTFLYSPFKQLVHTLFIQKPSVGARFYTLYTAPTITTIYINNRKEL